MKASHCNTTRRSVECRLPKVVICCIVMMVLSLDVYVTTSGRVGARR